MKKAKLITKIFLISLVVTLGVIKSLDFAFSLYETANLIETLFTPNASAHYHTSEFDQTDLISKQGLRNPDVSVPKPADTYRILVIGDSFTYGWGVKEDETWPKQLEKELQGVLKNKKIEVIDAGAPGMGPKQFSHVCDLYLGPLQIDATLWSLSYADLYRLHARAIGQPFATQSKLAEFATTLFPHLYSAIKGANFYEDLKPGQTLDIQTEWRLQAIAEAKKDSRHALDSLDPKIRAYYFDGLLSPTYVATAFLQPDYYILGMDSSSLNVSSDELIRQIDAGKNTCQGASTKMVGVLYFPGPVYVSSNAQSSQQKLGFQLDPSMLTSSLITDTLSNSVQETGLNYWDSTASLRQGCTDQCYYPLDGHPTAAGDAIVAKFLAPKIEGFLNGH